MTLIGYARVSTKQADTAPRERVDALRGRGCAVIFEDKASGASKERPGALLARWTGLDQGDTLLVVRIDRLARSLAHLPSVGDRRGALRAKGAYFRSINDPIDTSSPQGVWMTQMLGAFAEFERALSSASGRGPASRPLPWQGGRNPAIPRCANVILQQLPKSGSGRAERHLRRTRGRAAALAAHC